MMPVAVVLLACLVLVLSIRLVLMHRTVSSIQKQAQFILSNDTNLLIGIPPSERPTRRLAASLNETLCAIREKEIRLRRGDQEFQEALTAWSHDLRTPLTAISGYLALLSREEQTERAGEYIRVIESRMDAVQEITDELFDYALLRSEKKTSDVDLSDVLENTAAAFYDAFSARGIAVEIAMPERHVHILAEENAARRITYNLFSNALKYAGGPVRITLEDNGTLIFENAAPHLDPLEAGSLFGRHRSVLRGSRTRGIGMYAVRTLTEDLGGTFSGELKNGVLQIQITFRSAQTNKQNGGSNDA